VNRTGCDETICQQGYYDAFKACLNCIVANGNERPFGYYTNSSLSAAPTNTDSFVPINPNGFIDADQANGMLKNVTDKCSSLSTSLTGATSITASPTTT